MGVAANAAAREIASGSGARSRGASRARNGAGGPASSPSALGLENAWAAIAPIRVPVFQNANSNIPVAQNANLLRLASSRAIAIAVVSSITNWAARARRRPRTSRSEARRRPYRALREPSRAAAAVPAHTPPPAPITPTRANCDAPVHITADRKQVCRIDRPAAVEIAPQEMA